MSTVHDRIKEMRAARNYTLLEVAEKIGVKEATMQRYESGQIKNIKHETILALSDIFECSPAYLMGWIDTNAWLSDNSSEIELQLLRNFRSLNSDGMKEIINYTEYIKSQKRYTKSL